MFVATDLVVGCGMGSKFTNFLRHLVAPQDKDAPDRGGAETVDYNGFTIRPASRRQGSQWLTAGVITKQFEEELKEHHFIRAETHPSQDVADVFSITKAKQIIDELGDKIF